MTLQKNAADFRDAAESRKKIFDKAVKLYNSDLFQWVEYPKDTKVNKIGTTTSAVYAFFVKNPCVHVEGILTAVNQAKQANCKKNKLPKANKTNQNSFKEKGCLYVGSVTSEALGDRKKEHWRENSEKGDKTYALKLNDWINAAEIDKNDIVVYYCDLANQEKEMVRVIEDCLATMYCPLLGKRGDSPRI